MALNLAQLKNDLNEVMVEKEKKENKYKKQIQDKLNWFEERINSTSFEERLQESLEYTIKEHEGEMFLTITVPSLTESYRNDYEIYIIDTFGYTNGDLHPFDKPLVYMHMGDLEENDRLDIVNKFYDLFARRLDELGLSIISKPKFQLSDDETNTYEIYLKIKD